jgi:hypothetical protein
MKAQRFRALTLTITIMLGLGLALPLGAAWGHRVSPAATVAGTATVDPRLIVRPHIVRFHIALPQGGRLEGTLTPAIPGPNTVHLVAQPGMAGESRLDIEATMPGMAMAPAVATLTARGHEYRGALTLPMFGRYRLRITLAGGNTRPAGTAELPLLPSWVGQPTSAK